MDGETDGRVQIIYTSRCFDQYRSLNFIYTAETREVLQPYHDLWLYTYGLAVTEYMTIMQTIKNYIASKGMFDFEP